MNQVIYKYPVLFDAGKFTITMPEGAVFLHSGVQGNDWNMWFQVDSANDKVEYHFQVFGTGQAFDDNNLCHLATVFMSDGHLVWHLYMRPHLEKRLK